MYQVYGIRTRARAVNIFDTCAAMLAAMNELQKVILNADHCFFFKSGSNMCLIMWFHILIR